MSKEYVVECKTQFSSKEEREKFKAWLVEESGETVSHFQEYYLTKLQLTFFLTWEVKVTLGE